MAFQRCVPFSCRDEYYATVGSFLARRPHRRMQLASLDRKLPRSWARSCNFNMLPGRWCRSCQHCRHDIGASSWIASHAAKYIYSPSLAAEGFRRKGAQIHYDNCDRVLSTSSRVKVFYWARMSLAKYKGPIKLPAIELAARRCRINEAGGGVAVEPDQCANRSPLAAHGENGLAVAL